MISTLQYATVSFRESASGARVKKLGNWEKLTQFKSDFELGNYVLLMCSSRVIYMYSCTFSASKRTLCSPYKEATRKFLVTTIVSTSAAVNYLGHCGLGVDDLMLPRLQKMPAYLLKAAVTIPTCLSLNHRS